MSRTIVMPQSRAAVANPRLTRPDWTAGVTRDRKLLWLDKNENSDPELLTTTSAVIRDVVARIAPEAVFTYPESTPVYRKLAAYLGVTPANLLFAAGSDGVIRSVFETFVAEGDTVLHTAPTFAMYPVYSMMYGANEVPLEYLSTPSGPSLPVAAVVSAIHEAMPKVVCLPNPDSPTGTVFAPAELRQIIEAAGEAGALILIDEAYHPFYRDSAIGWIGEYPHLVVARTFAKAWGLAGLRIGYAVTSPEVAKLLHKVRPMYEVNTLAVAVVNEMLDHVDAMEASVARLNAGRDGFLQAMAELGFPTLRAHGNFLHVAFGEHAPAVHAALQSKVLYRKDGDDGPLKGWTRFSATTPALFAPIIKAIRGVVGRQA